MTNDADFLLHFLLFNCYMSMPCKTGNSTHFSLEIMQKKTLLDGVHEQKEIIRWTIFIKWSSTIKEFIKRHFLYDGNNKKSNRLFEYLCLR